MSRSLHTSARTYFPSSAERVPTIGTPVVVPRLFSIARRVFSQCDGPTRHLHRWLIVGGARSGSVFHIDPNGTSAWNAVVRGAKKWILYPPGCPPPGVFSSRDGSEVMAPVSLSEWFVTFYPRICEEEVSIREKILLVGRTTKEANHPCTLVSCPGGPCSLIWDRRCSRLRGFVVRERCSLYRGDGGTVCSTWTRQGRGSPSLPSRKTTYVCLPSSDHRTVHASRLPSSSRPSGERTQFARGMSLPARQTGPSLRMR